MLENAQLDDDVTKLVIPEGVREIGQMAFRCCYSIESLVIPGSVKVIGENAFVGCDTQKTAFGSALP